MATPWSATWCSRRGSGVTARSSARSAPTRSTRPRPASPCRPRERPGRDGTIPASRSGPKETIMTTIPFDGTAVPELPPLPIGALVACALDLMRETGDLPQPRYITIHQSTQVIGLQFEDEAPSLMDITRWALRFGSVLVSRPGEGAAGRVTWCSTEFDYYGVEVSAYAPIPVTATGT